MDQSTLDLALESAFGGVERFEVKRRVDESINSVTRAKEERKYDISTIPGTTQAFHVSETSDYDDCCTGRGCCSPSHKLKLHVRIGAKKMIGEASNKTSEILVYDRPCKCGQCCSFTDLCREEVQVYQGAVKRKEEPNPENLIGCVMQPFLGGLFWPQLNVMDREGETIATIRTNDCWWIGGEHYPTTYQVTTPTSSSEQSVGLICKRRDGDLLLLPATMDSKQKGIILAAVHLLDYMFYDNVSEADPSNGKCCDGYCCGCVFPCRFHGYGGSA